MRGSVAFIALALASMTARSRADGAIKHRGEIVVETPGHEAHALHGCVDDGDACDAKRLRELSGVALGAVGVTGGYDTNGHGLGGEVHVDAVTATFTMGSAYLGRAEAGFLPDENTTRLRLTVANLESLFACNANGLEPPIVGQMQYDCVPGRAVGLSALVGELQWDPKRGRFAARWGQVGAVFNLAGGSSSMDYLHGHVDASVGIAAESIWHGEDDARTGTDHVARGVVAIDAVARSRGGRWEASAQLAFRPQLFGTVGSLNDYGVLSEARVLHHFLAGPSAVVAAGLDARADYWSDAAMSIGPIDSVQGHVTLFVGAVLEVRHASPI